MNDTKNEGKIPGKGKRDRQFWIERLELFKARKRGCGHWATETILYFGVEKSWAPWNRGRSACHKHRWLAGTDRF